MFQTHISSTQNCIFRQKRSQNHHKSSPNDFKSSEAIVLSRLSQLSNLILFAPSWLVKTLSELQCTNEMYWIRHLKTPCAHTWCRGWWEMLSCTFRQSQMWQYFNSYWHFQFSLESSIPLDEDLLYGGKKTAMRNWVAYQTDITVSLCRQSTFSSQQALLLAGEDFQHLFFWITTCGMITMW